MNTIPNFGIEAEFEQARIKHLGFKSKLRGYLYGNGSERESIVEHDRCALGTWLLKIARQYDVGPELQDVNYHHQHIHAVARQLVELYDSGLQSEARDGFSEIEEVAKEMLASLEIAEKHLKEDY
jgi:hypothetical protein